MFRYQMIRRELTYHKEVMAAAESAFDELIEQRLDSDLSDEELNLEYKQILAVFAERVMRSAQAMQTLLNGIAIECHELRATLLPQEKMN